MGLTRILIANRGEIAVRIARSATERGLPAVAVYSEDDAAALHALRAEESVPLPGTGAAAYLDGEAILDAAERTGCDAIHPGYGFLSENPGFARRCAARGLVFIGPAPETLDLFGDKVRARAFAERCGVSVLPGTESGGGLEAARALLLSLHAEEAGGVMIKAAGGGGGRGMAAVHRVESLERQWPRCREEARRAFGRAELYAERLVPRARHIEVQVAGNGTGSVIDFGERECSLQRRRQKIVEMAPAPNLDPGLRERIVAQALALARQARFANLGTFEFLVDEAGAAYFIEANPRIQVEHTVTEEVAGVDLVGLQIALAGGAPLPEPGPPPGGRGFAMQARVNLESIRPDGTIRPAGGVITGFDLPSGAGVRVDAGGYAGYAPNPGFDPLVAKVVVRTDAALGPAAGFAAATRKLHHALGELRIAGVETNVGFLRALLAHPEVTAGRFHTGFVEAHLAELVEGAGAAPEPEARGSDRLGRIAAEAVLAGTRVDAADPLAVLAHGKGQGAGPGAASGSGNVAGSGQSGPGDAPPAAGAARAPGAVLAPMQGTVLELLVGPGDPIPLGRELLVMEAMKMQHVVVAERTGRVRRVAVRAGDTVAEGSPLLVLDDAEVAPPATDRDDDLDLDAIRPDLAEVRERQALARDERRPEAVARRRRTGQRTARENVDDLVDEGSFIEYGALVVAARRQRHSMEELVRRTPADGLVAGLGRVNGRLFGDEQARCLVMAYDYTVLAGTQGKFNHQKKDRMFALAEKWRLPMVFFAEGGGGRPGDTDIVFAADLHIPAFHLLGRLSGLVPLVGIASGRCFAGNAVVLGCCDVVIATRHANIGMGGPAMIEGVGSGCSGPKRSDRWTCRSRTEWWTSRSPTRRRR